MVYYIKNYLLHNKARFAILLIMAIITMSFSLVLPLLNRNFLNVLLLSPDKDYIIIYALIIVLISLLNCSINYFYQYNLKKYSGEASINLINKSISDIFHMDYLHFKSFNTEYLAQRIINDSNSIIGFIYLNFFPFFVGIFQFAFLILIILNANFKIFLLFVFFSPVYLILYLVIKKPLYNKGKDLKDTSTLYSGKIIEAIRLTPEIKKDNSEEQYINNMGKQFRDYYSSFLKFNKLSILFNSIDTIISVTFQAIVLVIGGVSVLSGKMTIGDFSMFLIFFNMYIKGLRSFLEYHKCKQDFLVSVNRMEEIRLIEKEMSGSVIVTDVRKISLSNIAFEYTQGHKIFNNLTIDFEKGRLTIIKGANGSGKSTLGEIMIGLIKCQKGYVIINDEEIKNIDIFDLRKKRVTVLPQGCRYPNESVFNYLSMFGMDGKQYDYARKLFIECFNIDIQLFLTKNLLSLSEGERQKINLFKTLLKKADAYIFDEPESYLDKNSINSLPKFFSQLKKNHIVIIISHSEFFDDIADSIITL